MPGSTRIWLSHARRRPARWPPRAPPSARTSSVGTSPRRTTIRRRARRLRWSRAQVAIQLQGRLHRALDLRGAELLADRLSDLAQLRAHRSELVALQRAATGRAGTSSSRGLRAREPQDQEGKQASHQVSASFNTSFYRLNPTASAMQDPCATFLDASGRWRRLLEGCLKAFDGAEIPRFRSSRAETPSRQRRASAMGHRQWLACLCTFAAALGVIVAARGATSGPVGVPSLRRMRRPGGASGAGWAAAIMDRGEGTRSLRRPRGAFRPGCGARRTPTPPPLRAPRRAPSPSPVAAPLPSPPRRRRRCPSGPASGSPCASPTRA